jgi:hypothetical protein
MRKTSSAFSNSLDQLRKKLDDLDQLRKKLDDLDQLPKKFADLDQLSSRFYDLERIVKGTGLKLADDWALFFKRGPIEYEDPLAADIQLSLVLLLFLTWQLPNGYSMTLSRLEEHLEPHGVKRKEIVRAFEQMRKVGLVERDGERYGLVFNFLERVGPTLGYGEEIEKRKRKAKK